MNVIFKHKQYLSRDYDQKLFNKVLWWGLVKDDIDGRRCLLGKGWFGKNRIVNGLCGFMSSCCLVVGCFMIVKAVIIHLIVINYLDV